MINEQNAMINEMPSSEVRFDLEERTARFGEAIIGFLRTLPADEITRSLIRQCVRSGTSVGANYIEANEADSRKEFRYRISVARREAKETKHWIRMLVCACPASREQAADLWREADELVRIFSKIKASLKTKDAAAH
jgi:four helix bundle protein